MAFYTGKKLMQFIYVPHGFKNRPTTFQKTRKLIFQERIVTNCVFYIDYILYLGRTVQEHDENIKIIENLSKKYSLTENKEKRCEHI